MQSDRKLRVDGRDSVNIPSWENGGGLFRRSFSWDGLQVQPPSGGLKPSDWSDVDGGVNGRRPRPVKREEPRRHTVAGENIKGKDPDNPSNMDLERYNRSRKLTKSSSESGDPKKDLILGHLQRRFPEYASTIAGHKDQSHLYSQRGHSVYQPPASIYDDDPGIMSEVETSATGFRRGGKQRSSLPVVRTPNKTLERPLGLVFLQYRSETKRALLPNEITSLDTVKALFVRSFPKQLTMEYLDSPHIRIYIHDPSKDMFYELEDLRDIRDRSVLRIYEQDVNGGGTPSNWDQDLSYFSEPEFDSDYQHQHIHRAKKSLGPPSNYYGTMTHSYPPSLSMAHTATLPRTSQPMRSYSPAPSTLEKPKPQALPPTGPVQPPPKPQRTYQQPVTSIAKSVRATPPPQGPPPPAPSPRTNQAAVSPVYQMSPERPVPYRATPERSYTQPSFASPELRHDDHPSPERRHHPTHESGYHSSPERRVDHHRSFPTYLTPSSSYEDSYYGDRSYGSRSGSVTPIIDEEARLRMQMMERQLANLTGLVHKALTTGRQSSLTRDVEVNLNKEHVQVPPSSTPTPPVTRDTGTPYRSTVEKPTKSAIKPSSRQTSLTEVQLTPEMYNQLRLLKKKTKDLRLEVRNLRRMSQAQALNIKETIRETFLKIKAMLAAVQVNDQVQSERVRVSREEELYTQDVQRLEKDLSELESAVEELRSNVINRRCRVNMSDVESMALVLSKSSKTVADLKARFPNLQESLKAVMAAEMEVVVHEEKFLKEEPERLETALRRCKKLTGTLVTLKRLASVQEQRLPPSGSGPLSPSLTGEQREHALPHGGSLDAQLSKAASFSGELRSSYDGQKPQKAENALDALLDELQTFAKPLDHKTEVVLGGSLKRVSSYSGTESPVKGQLVSQGSSGMGSTSLNATTVSKLQVSEAGSKHNVSLSPTPSPIPTEGKISPVSQELLNKMSTTIIKQTEGTDGSNITKSVSPVPGVTKKVPPPPPPRTSSKSPLMSPTSPMSPTNRLLAVGTLPRGSSLQGTVLARVSSFEPGLSHFRSNTELVTDDSDVSSSRSVSRSVAAKKDPSLVIRTSAISDENLRREQLSSNSSSSESVNSQEGVQMRLGHHADRGNSHGNIHHISSGAMSDSETIKKPTPPLPPSRNRQELLEQRHQELLRKQRQLQEQYARLQQLQRGQTLQRFSPPRSPADLKKTGSESNILLKAGLTMSPASGSLTHLAPLGKSITTSNSFIGSTNVSAPVTPPSATTTAATVSSNNQVTSKIYETDIL